MADTKIEWCARPGTKPKTWNPTRGCRIHSQGCARCYAMRQAHRFSGPGGKYEGLTVLTAAGPIWTGAGRLAIDMLDAPLRWKQPCTIFVDSMSDLFYEAFTDEEIAAVFGVMAACYWHTFIVLTKRAERLPKWFEWIGGDLGRINDGVRAALKRDDIAVLPTQRHGMVQGAWPLPNVWLGVSVEDQKHADERIPYLLDTPAAVRLISAEPLLGPIDLTRVRAFKSPPWPKPIGGDPWLDVLCGEGMRPSPLTGVLIESHLDRHIDWCIVGGESGAGARPMHPQWARSLRDQCVAADVPYFFKQWGAWGEGPGGAFRADGSLCDFKEDRVIDCGEGFALVRIGKKLAGRELDGRTWDEFPEVRA